MKEARSGSPGARMAQNRRRFLLSAAAVALAAPGGFALCGGARAADIAGRSGGFVIVNGWVLTQADLALLGDHAS